MPIISVFFGIIIRLYHGDHNPPHFHAVYGEFEAIIDIKTGKVIEGKLPSKALKLIEEWRKQHISELNSGWSAVSSMKMPKKIKGLE